MKKVLSKQRSVAFIICRSPLVIDKRGSWGNSPENFQEAPNGAFLKMKDATEVSHLVQPNADFSAPVGWVPGSAPGLFDKAPIWIDEKIHQAGETIEVDGLDGFMEYIITEPSVTVYNEQDGQPNLKDGWVQKMTDLEKNYIV